jgi:hypothetical protein
MKPQKAAHGVSAGQGAWARPSPERGERNRTNQPFFPSAPIAMDFAENDYMQDLQRFPPSPQNQGISHFASNINSAARVKAGGGTASQGYDRPNSRVLWTLPATHSASGFCLGIPVKRNHFNRSREGWRRITQKIPDWHAHCPQPSVPFLASVAANPPLPSRI